MRPALAVALQIAVGFYETHFAIAGANNAKFQIVDRAASEHIVKSRLHDIAIFANNRRRQHRHRTVERRRCAAIDFVHMRIPENAFAIDRILPDTVACALHRQFEALVEAVDAVFRFLALAQIGIAARDANGISRCIALNIAARHHRNEAARFVLQTKFQLINIRAVRQQGGEIAVDARDIVAMQQAAP